MQARGIQRLDQIMAGGGEEAGLGAGRLGQCRIGHAHRWQVLAFVFLLEGINIARFPEFSLIFVAGALRAAHFQRKADDDGPDDTHGIPQW